MSSLSQFYGGASVPIGGLVIAPNMPTNFTQDGKEYLRTGAAKAYDSSYAATVAAAPSLAIYGISEATGTAANSPNFYGMLGANYINLNGTTTGKYSSDLITWNTMTSSNSPSNANLLRLANNGTSWVVSPQPSNNNAHVCNSTVSTATTWGNVGGTFTTHAVTNAIAYGNSWWVALADITGTAGGLSYINNANPTGTWTITASPSLSGTAAGARAIAYGGASNWFVACGLSASATAGKLATCTVPTAWTDRTTVSGAVSTANDSFDDVVFDGTNFVLYNGTSKKVYTTTNPTGAWTLGGDIPVDGVNAANYVGGTMPSLGFKNLVTDGAGTVVAFFDNGSAGYSQRVSYKSTDHGMTWTPFTWLALFGRSASFQIERASYTNGRFFFNNNGNPLCYTRISSFATPAYIGTSYQTAQGFYVRIK